MKKKKATLIFCSVGKSRKEGDDSIIHNKVNGVLDEQVSRLKFNMLKWSHIAIYSRLVGIPSPFPGLETAPVWSPVYPGFRTERCYSWPSKSC